MHAPNESKAEPKNPASKKTTGWTEETRNIFHPGDIISILRLDFAGYSPFEEIGLAELACHCSGDGREFCQPFISKSGSIFGFFGNVMPRAEEAQPFLRRMFPEIASFADELGKRNLPPELFRSAEKKKQLQLEIESKFGSKVVVPTTKLSIEEREQKAREREQNSQTFFGKPVTKLTIVVEESVKSDDAGKTYCGFKKGFLL